MKGGAKIEDFSGFCLQRRRQDTRPLGEGQKCWVSHFVLNPSILGKRSLNGEMVRSGDTSSDVSWVGGLLVSGFLKC